MGNASFQNFGAFFTFMTYQYVAKYLCMGVLVRNYYVYEGLRLFILIPQPKFEK